MKTKKTGFLSRFLSAFLIAALCLPPPALALRPELSPKTKAGIEQDLVADSVRFNLGSLLGVMDGYLSARDEEAVGEAFVHGVEKILGYEFVVLYLVDPPAPGREEFMIRNQFRSGRFKRESGVASGGPAVFEKAWALRSTEPSRDLLIADRWAELRGPNAAAVDPVALDRDAADYAEGDKTKVRSVYYVILDKADGTPWGLLAVSNWKSGRDLFPGGRRKQIRSLLRTLGNGALLALENARSFQRTRNYLSMQDKGNQILGGPLHALRNSISRVSGRAETLPADHATLSLLGGEISNLSHALAAEASGTLEVVRKRTKTSRSDKREPEEELPAGTGGPFSGEFEALETLLNEASIEFLAEVGRPDADPVRVREEIKTKYEKKIREQYPTGGQDSPDLKTALGVLDRWETLASSAITSVQELQAENEKLIPNLERLHSRFQEFKDYADKLELLLKSLPENDEELERQGLDREGVEDVRKLHDRIQRLLGDVDTFIEQVGSMLGIHLKPVAGAFEPLSEEDPSAVIRRVIDSFEWKGTLRYQGVQGAPPGSLLRVSAAQTKLMDDLLTDLLTNSMKFRRMDRDLEVSVSEEYDPGASRFIVTVEDNGEGIPEITVMPDGKTVRREDWLFRPGQRGKWEGVQGRGGTGLGLADASSRLKKMGGEIQYVPRKKAVGEAKEGEETGSVFQFWLKIIPQPAPRVTAAGLEAADYEGRQTDPHSHDDKNFTYFVHMTTGWHAGLVSATGMHPDFFTEPQKIPMFSTSILHRDPGNQVLSTFENQQVGYIVRVPQENIAWVAPYDFISGRDEEYLQPILQERDQRGLLPFDELIDASQRYGLANEALVLGTGPSGKRVETVGLILVKNPFQGWEAQMGNDKLIAQARELGLPVVTVEREDRPARPGLSPGIEEVLKKLNLPPNPTPEQIAQAQAQFSSLEKEIERVYWNERMKYSPAVFRQDPPAAGAEDPGFIQATGGPLKLSELAGMMTRMGALMAHKHGIRAVTYRLQSEGTVIYLPLHLPQVLVVHGKEVAASPLGVADVRAAPDDGSLRWRTAFLNLYNFIESALREGLSLPPGQDSFYIFRVPGELYPELFPGSGPSGEVRLEFSIEPFNPKGLRSEVPMPRAGERMVQYLGRLSYMYWQMIQRDGSAGFHLWVDDLTMTVPAQNSQEEMFHGIGEFFQILGARRPGIATLPADPWVRSLVLRNMQQGWQGIEIHLANEKGPGTAAGAEDLFVGMAEPVLDGHHRFYLPVKWKGLRNSKFLVIQMDEWEGFRYLSLRPFSDPRAFAGGSAIPVDSQKRVRIGREAAAWAEAGWPRKIVLVGVGDHVELWSKPAWEKFLAAHAGLLDGGVPLTRAGTEQPEPRLGSWGPITFELKRLPAEDRAPLMEAIDRFLRGTTSLDRSLEQSHLGNTQLYGIPWMMAALVQQADGDLATAVERISFALDWATSLKARLYPDKTTLIDPDDLFLPLLGRIVPLAGEAGSSEEGYRRNLKNLAALLLDLRVKTPGERMAHFSSQTEPFFSYYAGFPPALRPRGPQGFASHLALFEKLASEGRKAETLAPEEFVKWARQSTGMSGDMRFVPAKGERGIIGFLVEGQGLPLAKLFSLAAADGHSIYFSGIAAREQLDALARGLSPEAAALLRERIVLIDGRGQEAARDAAMEKLRQQVPVEDQAVLATVRVDFLMRELLRQIENYLRMAGWDLADPVDRERALALVESA